MAKYPISIQDSIHDGKVSVAFGELLKLHAKAGNKILDPTAGQRLLWKSILFPNDSIDLGIKPEYDVTFSDIKGGNENLIQDLNTAIPDRPDWLHAFDLIIYDPPYLIGKKKTDDPREDMYGTYSYSLDELNHFMKLTSLMLPGLLKPQGKLIVKCSDQYLNSERKFYLFHYDWITEMKKFFTIVDIMIYRHHRMSPTAFQVKDRPCSVIMHSYYIVGVKQ